MMNENEYTLAHNRTELRHALHHLQEIIPDETIPRAELEKIRSQLRAWFEKSYPNLKDEQE
jgi:hypothetical protein